jgi:2-dehydro-3-deoxyphosphogluconate aldolase/(4S)-4-hydroxy-2-oxoglutarate aldolase
MSAPFVHAVGGSWLCTKADIASGNFARITALCTEACEIALDFELAHIGINTEDAEAALSVSGWLGEAFGFDVREGNQSIFASNAFEVMKSKYLGDNGHIAIRTNSLARAIIHLEKKGFFVDPETAKTKNGKLTAIYIKDQIGGFAIHLVQK